MPNLSNNIKCGNSLIGPDYFSGRLIPDPDEMKRVNPFDWNREFPDAMKSGGFDCVIGNPPYVRQEALGEFKKYFQEKFEVFNGAADLYTYFIERGVSLLKNESIFSYIVSNKWMRANYGEPLRKWLKKQPIEEIIDFGDLPVFQTATTYPCILRIAKENPKTNFNVSQIKTLIFPNLSDHVKDCRYQINQQTLDDKGWSLADKKTQDLLTKINVKGIPLGEYIDRKIYRGVLTGLNEAFVIDEVTKNKLIKEDSKSAELIKPFLAGRDIKRYAQPESDKYLIFARHGVKINDYPAIKEYLSQFKDRLLPKPKNWKGTEWKGRKPGAYQWYEIQDTIDYYEEFEKPKIMYLVFQVKPAFTIDKKGIYANNAVWIVPKADNYLLGILNSKLGWFLISNYCTQIQNGFQLIFKYLGKIPINAINFSDPTKKQMHNKMIQMVESIIDLNLKKTETRSERDIELIQRQIDSTDREIDRLVYELYGLTDEEIKIVESTS